MSGNVFVTSSERLLWNFTPLYNDNIGQFTFTVQTHAHCTHLLVWQCVVHDAIHGAFPNPHAHCTHLLVWQCVVHDAIHGAFPNPHNLHESNNKRQLTRRQRYCSLHCSASPIANDQLLSTATHSSLGPPSTAPWSSLPPTPPEVLRTTWDQDWT